MKHHAPRVITRRLRLGDIPALLELEHRQWTPEQSASADDFRERMRANPTLCNGAFDAATGELLASLFCKPTSETEWLRPGDWKTSAALTPSTPLPPRHDGAALFGISLTSVEPGAALQLIAYQYLNAIRGGKRYVYLGSPMPGLSRHLARHPEVSVQEYAFAKRSGLPLDPQLRYYHGKGFRDIVSVRENYFPHAASRDYAAILRSRVPLPWLRPLLLVCPESLLRMLAVIAPRMVIARQARQPFKVSPV